VKENLASSEKVDIHEEDSSVTRPISLLRTLLKQAGLRCIKEQKQKNLPRGLYTVKMFALVPDIIKICNSSDDCYTTQPSVTSGDNGET
jgi:protein N-terminal methyltransferase